MQAIIKKLSLLLSAALLFSVVLSGNTIAMTDGETEAASESHLLRIMLPSNAQRVLPQHIPAEITETLKKVTEQGGGKLRQGETEVLIWAGASYKKANAAAIIGKLVGNIKTAGWQYSVEGEESGITAFLALREGTPRRAVVGFYGATDDALILAATEILSNNAGAEIPTAEPPVAVADEPEPPMPSSMGGAVVGTWNSGKQSILNQVETYTGRTTPLNGSVFKYVFHSNGSFEYVGYMESTMYGCTTALFNDKRGKYAVNGNRITMTPNKNFWRNTYSCAPNSNKERNHTLETETLTFRVNQNQYDKEQICLANAKGEESCFQRQE